MASSSASASTVASSATASATSFVKRYAPPKPAPLPEDYEEFYAGLTEAEKELDLLAKEWLGSSYFIQWSHMYTKWAKTKSEKTKAERVNVVSEEKGT